MTQSAGLLRHDEQKSLEGSVTVYRFQTWDRGAGLQVWATQMGTREAVRRVKGEADLKSALLVDEGEVDSNGLHTLKTPPPASADNMPLSAAAGAGPEG